MINRWEKFDTHPEIGPLIEEFRYTSREMEHLKQDLRTRDNIDDIMRASYDHAELKRRIDGLVDEQLDLLFDRRRDSLWIAVTAALAVVGLANVLLGMGFF